MTEVIEPSTSLVQAIERQDMAAVLRLALADADANEDCNSAAELLSSLASWLEDECRQDEAVQLRVRALERIATAGADQPRPDPRRLSAEVVMLAGLFEAKGDLATAAALVRIAADVTRAAEGEDSRALHVRLYHLADLLAKSGQQDASDAVLDEVEALAHRHAAHGQRYKTMSLDERARSEEVEEPKKRLVEVFFATNRDVRKTEDVYKRFGGGRNEAINYGIAEVSVPVNRAAGTLAVPRRFWQFRDWYENDSMFLLKALEPLRDRAGWLERLREQVAIGRGRELLLFVHGFNTEFWEAVLRAAQLHADLGIDGATAVYSWPSRGSAALYDADRTTIDVFRTALQGLIADLAEPFAPGAGSDPVKPRLIIVAHSMGCDYTLKALERLVLQLPAGGLAGGAPLISEVIFAAPDVDLSVFKRDVVTVAPLASRVTAYCSEADVALWLSRTAVHRFERAGRKAEALAGLGLDGIDTTLAAGSRLLEFAHNDYATTTLVDLKAILCGDKPEQRLHLAPANVAAGTYWGMMPKMLKTSEGQVYAMSVDARRGTSALSEPFTM